MQCGEEQLSLANQLLAECRAVRKKGKGRRTDRGKKSGIAASTAGATGGRRPRGFMTTRRYVANVVSY